ncbi:hypothetical protein TKK_0009321 [Trichogramma kaykai]
MYLENCAVISLVLIALLFVNSVNSFSCYTCSSFENSECLTNPVQDKFITECNPTRIRAHRMNVSINDVKATLNGVPISIGTTISDDEKTIAIYDGTTVDVTSVSGGDIENNYTVTTSGSIKEHTFNWNWNPKTVVVRACVPKHSRCRCNRAVRCFRCQTELCNSAESPTLTLGTFALLGVVGVYSSM